MRVVLINTVLWIILAPILATAFGLVLALLIDRMRARSEKVTKSLIFLPMAISFVGASVIWKFVYQYNEPTQPQIGLLSQVAIWLGWKNPPNWLLNTPLNTFMLIVIMIWVQTGFAMVVLSAAIKAIPDDVLEAAALDGATGWQMFVRVTIPMIRGTLIVVFTTILIAVLKIFDIVATMTGGNFNTSVLSYEMYSPDLRPRRPGTRVGARGHPVRRRRAGAHLQHRPAAEGACDPMSTVEGQQTIKVNAPRVTADTGTKVRQTLSSRLASLMVVLLTVVWTVPTFGLLVTSLRPAGRRLELGLVDGLRPPELHPGELPVGAVLRRLQRRRAGCIPYFVNSLTVSIPGTLFPLALATMAAYALAWIPFKGANTLFFFVFGLQVVPIQLALVPLLRFLNTGVHIGSVPVFPALGVTGHFASLWITHTMFAMPLAIFLLHNFMVQLPRDLMEAARVDGANSFLIFRKIVLPLTAPSIASFAIFQFLWVWNDLLVSLTFVGAGKDSVSPLTTRLQAAGRQLRLALGAARTIGVRGDHRAADRVLRTPEVLRPGVAGRLGQGLTRAGEGPHSEPGGASLSAAPLRRPRRASRSPHPPVRYHEYQVLWVAGIIRWQLRGPESDVPAQGGSMAAAQRRPVVVGGNRTPFARAGGAYARSSNRDLLTAALDGLVARFGLAGETPRGGGRGRGAQAQPGLQPHPGVGARLRAWPTTPPPTTCRWPARPAWRR